MAGLDFLEEELAALAKRGLRRRARPVDGNQGPTVVVDGRKAINFSSNNYLGLADAQALVEAARSALGAEGFGAGASRLIVGNLRPHRELEVALSHFHETEAALLFNSGYHANVGVLAALAGAEDIIYSDALNHASIVDGCRLSRARIEVFPHADTAWLEGALRRCPGRRRFIVSDSVFSMDGDLAPLRELRALADEFGAILIVDEAHATGILGPGGRGACARVGVRADVHVGTLSKGLGAFGAYVAGTRTLVEYLANRARSFVFTTALPPSVPAAALAALQLIRGPAGEGLRSALMERTTQFGTGLTRLGLRPLGESVTPIFPVFVGDAERTMALSERLLELGTFAQGIRPPTVPVGTSRLRFSLMATHTADQVQAALDAIATLMSEGLVTLR